MRNLLTAARRCAPGVLLAAALPGAVAAPAGAAASPPAPAAAATRATPPPPSAQTAAGDAAKGRLLFESRCVACHSLEENRVGPALGTVFGRMAGRQPGFAYSAALARANHVWTADQLQAWLTDPEALVPGQAMGFRVALPQDRLDIATFLQSLAAGRSP